MFWFDEEVRCACWSRRYKHPCVAREKRQMRKVKRPLRDAVCSADEQCRVVVAAVLVWG
jgi:hypothetical protein